MRISRCFAGRIGCRTTGSRLGWRPRATRARGSPWRNRLSVAFFIVRLAVAALFLVAALAKFPNRQRTRARVRIFGVPERLSGPVALVLPVGELAIAVLIVPAATARLGAVLAAVVLVMFSAAVARLMIRGEAPECHCFGPLHSSSVGPGMLARNLLLAGLALCAAIVGAGSDMGVPVPVWVIAAAAITVGVLGVQAWVGPRRQRRSSDAERRGDAWRVR
jgi:uncharacterized membrane protein YphA (DoxX/SURF4 family)